VEELALKLEQYIADKVTYLKNPQVSNLRCINSGWESDVYAFCLNFLHAGTTCTRKMILRSYTGQDVPLFPHKPLHEFQVLHQLCADGYPVPEVYLLECDAACLGNPFVLMEQVEGEVLDKVFAKASTAKRSELLQTSAELLAELHSLNPKPYLAKSDEPESSLVEQELEKHITLAALFGAKFALPGFEWLRKQSKFVSEQQAALAHWDFHLGNIIMTPEKQPVVIDWTISTVTDYRFDLAWSLLFLGEAGDSFVTMYEQASEKKVEHLDFFMAFACLRRLLTMLVSIEQGAEVLGMRPGAEKIIRQHKGHIEGVYKKWVQLTGQSIPHVEEVIAAL